ncbi:MAG: hypothetical protein KC445_09455 [Anaerolineales bacterium]|nr:hypothetical protein [Anaerolineales bacterium]
MNTRVRAMYILLAITALVALLLSLLTHQPTQPAFAGAAEPTRFVYLPQVFKNGRQDTVEFQPLFSETPVLKGLAAQETHLFPIVFDYSGTITITAVAEPTMDIVLEIVDNSNSVLHTADSGGAGALEAFFNTQLNPSLDYKIQIYERNGIAGNYCLIFNEEGGFPDQIKGRIEFGQTVIEQLAVLGIDYWCFLGTAGDNVTISATPTTSGSDLAIGLFGPPDFTAIGTVFASPEMTNVDLSADGFYLIGVLDFEAGAADYSLQLTKN